MLPPILWGVKPKRGRPASCLSTDRVLYSGFRSKQTFIDPKFCRCRSARNICNKSNRRSSAWATGKLSQQVNSNRWTDMVKGYGGKSLAHRISTKKRREGEKVDLSRGDSYWMSIGGRRSNNHDLLNIVFRLQVSIKRLITKKGCLDRHPFLFYI